MTATLLEVRLWSLPAQIFDRIEDGCIHPQRGKSAKQEGVAPGVEQRFREHPRLPDRWMPMPPVFRNVLKVRILSERKCGCLGSPSADAGKAIGAIAYHREVVRYGLRPDAKFL